MRALASLQQILDSVNVLQCDHLLAHNLRSNNGFTRWWNHVFDHWHLFASGCPLIQGTSKEISNLVSNGNCDNHWSENLNILRSLHQNDCQGIGHPSVSRHKTCARKNDIATDDGLLLYFVMNENPSEIINAIVNGTTHSTSDDHSRKEESSWHVRSISCNREEVPNSKESEQVCRGHGNLCIHDVLDDATFTSPEKTSIGINHAIITPSLVSNVLFRNVLDLRLTNSIVCPVY